MKERGPPSLVTAFVVEAILSMSGSLVCCVVLCGFCEREVEDSKLLSLMRFLVDAKMVERGDPAEPTGAAGNNEVYIFTTILLTTPCSI